MISHLLKNEFCQFFALQESPLFKTDGRNVAHNAQVGRVCPQGCKIHVHGKTEVLLLKMNNKNTKISCEMWTGCMYV